MRKYLFLALFAVLALSSCANSSDTKTSGINNDTSDSQAVVSSESDSSDESIANEPSSVTESEPQENDSGLNEFVGEIDDSVHFDTYEQFADSKDLQNYLHDSGITLDQLSEPKFDPDKFTLNGDVTMYSGCAYYSIKDIKTGNNISISLSFKQFENYSEMKQHFEELFGPDNGAFSTGEFTSDDKNEVYINKGNCLTLYRLSEDGLIYGIYCEEISDEELYTYLDEIKL